MHRFLLSVMVALTFLSTAIAQDVFTAHDLFKLTRVVDAKISPNGSHIAYLVQRSRPFEEGKGSNYRDLYVYDLETNKAMPYLVGDRMLYGLDWHPNGKTITFQARMDGDRQTEIYGINLDGGAYYKVVDLPMSPVSYAWDPKGDAIAYIGITPARGANAAMEKYGFDAEVFEEEQSQRDLYVFYTEKGENVKVNQSGAVFGFAWHPDGKHLAAQIAPQNLVDDSYMLKDIYLINLYEGTQELWVDVPGKLSDIVWSKKGNHLAIICAADINDPVSGSLFVATMGEQVAFSDLRNYTTDFEGHVSSVTWRNDETMLYTVSESTYIGLREIEIDEEASNSIVPAGPFHFSGIQAVGNTAVLIGDSKDHPNELYLLDVKKGEFTRLTNLNPWLADMKMGKQETISWKAKDGLRIDGVLIYPVDYEEGVLYPMIVEVHGGPEAHISDGWQTYYSRRGQIAAGRGYFVLYPNYRSSSGRGVAFSKMGFGDLADEEFTDILDGIDYLIDEGMVDGAKVGIGGGSYGGYFSAWGATKHSEYFAAACPFVGISNQISKRNTTDIPYEDYLVHWGIWTNEDVALMYDRSPVKYVENNQTPTLILHGKEDPRVHPSQSLELYRQLKMHGDAAVRLIWYPGEGHGNRNNPAQLDFCLRTMRWFDFYLKEGNSEDDMPAKDIDYDIDLK